MEVRNEEEGRPSAAAPPKAGPALPIARRIAPIFRRSSLWSPTKSAEQRMPMVGWSDPGQLGATGVKTLFSLIVGERSDRRLMLALANKRCEYYDHTVHYRDTPHGPQRDDARLREDVWIDFVCDTGDGWKPTFAIAYAAAQEQLRVSDGQVGVLDVPRADVLVFGGDEVYPTPSRKEYQRRLVMPYTNAYGDASPAERPHVYAAPGNHDWYDGLSAFSRLFCSDVGGRDFAGWHTRQHRSYFALKRPGKWWLLGSDGQLQSDLDTGQIDYFREIAEHQMKAGDQVILCLSIPVWTYAHKYRSMGREFDETDLLYLLDEVLAPRGIDVKVYLTGDLHHYRRHEELNAPAGSGSPIQKITAGGGGAFLHPTHEEDLSVLTESTNDPKASPRSFAQRASYPDARTSSRLAWGNLFFLFKNPKAGIVPASMYLLTAWLAGAAMGDVVPRHPGHALKLTGDAFGGHPGLAIWMIAFVAGFLAFTDTHSKAYRVIGGLLHCAAHWVALFYIGWGSVVVADHFLHVHPFLGATATGAMIVGGGWVFGTMILGIYLLISINVFGRHSEEAFSALRIQDYKHFLRMRITKEGGVTIYPIKVEKVPRNWRDRMPGEPSNSFVQPMDPVKAELIERPIVLG